MSLLKDNSLDKEINDKIKKDIVETAGHRWLLDTDDVYVCVDCGKWACSKTDFKSIGVCIPK